RLAVVQVDRDVLRRFGFGSAVPVSGAGIEADALAGADLPYRLARPLKSTSTGHDDEDLRPGVRVPVRTSAGLEPDPVQLDRHLGIRAGDESGERRALEGANVDGIQGKRDFVWHGGNRA